MATARPIKTTVDHADIRGLVTSLLSSALWTCPHSRNVHRRYDGHLTLPRVVHDAAPGRCHV